MSATVDMTLLHQRIPEWAKIVGVTVDDALAYHAGQLKWELMAGAPPKSLAKSQAKAVKDTKKVFFAGKEGGKALDIFFGPQAQGKGMRWLYAGPKYLVGVQPDDFQPGMGVDQMQREMNEYRRGFFRGAGWHEIGIRGRGAGAETGGQHVHRINRTIVRRGELEKLRKVLKNNFGKLKAAWAVGMEQFPVAASKAIPGWVKKHIPTASGRNEIHLSGPATYVEIINFSPGVTHDRAMANVRRAVKKRAGAIKKDLQLYLQGIKKAADFKMPSLFKLTLGLIAPLWIAFYAQSVLAASALVTHEGRISQYQSLSQRATDGEEHLAQVEEVFDHPALHRAGHAIAGEQRLRRLHPAQPSAGRIRRIEHHELDLRRPLAVLRGEPGNGEGISPRPQFAIEAHAGRQLPRESLGRGDAVAIACPERIAIPEGPATVELLAEMPAREIGFAVPILEQRHVAFIHAKSLMKPVGQEEVENAPGFVMLSAFSFQLSAFPA